MRFALLHAWILFCLALGLGQRSHARTLTGFLSTEAGSSFQPWGSEEHSAYLSLFGMATYRWNDDWRLSLQVPANQSLTDPVEFTLFDWALTASKTPIALNPSLSLVPSLGAVLPISTRSRLRESLRLGVRGGLRVLADFSRLPRLSWLGAFYELSATKAFHEFETATTGAVNQEYRFSQRLNLSAQATDHWSFSVDALRFSNLSYQRNFRNSFSITETVSYSASQALTVSAGISNEGDVLRANGIDSNLAIFDPTASRAFLSLSLAL